MNDQASKHDLIAIADGSQTHIYRWPRGESPLPLAGVLAHQTACGQITFAVARKACIGMKSLELLRAGRLHELADYLDLCENEGRV